MPCSTKQGRENQFKPLLSDLGLHHPPSGRLGATQAFAFVCAMAANIHAVLSLRVVAKADRAIRPPAQTQRRSPRRHPNTISHHPQGWPNAKPNHPARPPPDPLISNPTTNHRENHP